MINVAGAGNAAGGYLLASDDNCGYVSVMSDRQCSRRVDLSRSGEAHIEILGMLLNQRSPLCMIFEDTVRASKGF